MLIEYSDMSTRFILLNILKIGIFKIRLIFQIGYGFYSLILLARRITAFAEYETFSARFLSQCSKFVRQTRKSYFRPFIAVKL